MTSNVKPAPPGLTEGLVAKMVGDRPAYGKGIAHIPIASFADCGECGQRRTKPCGYSACPISEVGGDHG
ncbi:MAG: hypothetical protein GW855_07760 [Erythrobacter sp.]|nr:hypothetical protein [Erythrobacter sp.]NCQ62433.1 hypothetical protein [Alphaproteobacteria bacterium]